MFHLTCYGWLVFRSRSVEQIVDLTAGVFRHFAPASLDVWGSALPLALYTTPLVVVHALEAWRDDLLIVPRLPLLSRYIIYAATFYFIMLFGNFGGAEFIYFQF
jgi:hypothetical protein